MADPDTDGGVGGNARLNRRMVIAGETLYGAMGARRLQWDNLVWQVPVVGLTAQAFLFTIGLGADSSRMARTLSMLLSLLTTVLTLQLMARHRRAEVLDAAWLQAYEQEVWGLAMHGSAFQTARDDSRIGGPLAGLPSFRTWSWGLSLFGIAALVVLVTTWTRPDLLS